MNLRIYSWNEL